MNTFRAINSRPVVVIKYSAGVVDWQKDKVQILDRKSRNN